MKQKKMLVLTFSQLKQIYNQEMPELVKMAVKSPTVEDFKAGLLMYLDACEVVNETAKEARERRICLLNCSSCLNACRGRLFLCRRRNVSRAGMTGGLRGWMKRCVKNAMRTRSGCCIC